MLERIDIKNYQSLSDVVIEPGKFTAIIGQSNCGKSALIRALESMVTNSAVCGADWSYLPAGSNKTHISITLDGHVVEWVKGKNINNYTVDGELLKNVGRGCPEEVTHFLRMSEISIDGSKFLVNFDRQFDLPFLCDASGSMVAKILGEITNVNLLIAANKEANKEKINKNKLKLIREKDLIELRGEKEQYAQLESKRKFLEVLKVSREKVQNKIKALEALAEIEKNLIMYSQAIKNSVILVNNLKTTLKGLETNLKLLNDKLLAVNVFSDIALKLEQLKVFMDKTYDEVAHWRNTENIEINRLFNMVDRYNKLIDIIKNLVVTDQKVKTSEVSLAKLNCINLIKLPDISSYLDSKRVIAQIDRTEKLLSKSRDKKDVVMVELDKRKIALKDFIKENPLCPVCNKPLDNEEV